MTHNQTTQQEEVFQMLWDFLADWKCEFTSGGVSDYGKDEMLKSLTNTLTADVGLLVASPAGPSPARESYHVCPDHVSFNSAKRVQTPIAPLDAATCQDSKLWHIPLMSPLLSLSDTSCSFYERNALSQPPTGPCDGFHTFLRGTTHLGDTSYFLIFAWSEPLSKLPIARLYGPAMLNVWLRLAAWWTTHDDIAAALIQWAQKHPKPDEPLLSLGERQFNPKELVREVLTKTPLGQNLRASIVDAAIQHVLGDGDE